LLRIPDRAVVRSLRIRPSDGSDGAQLALVALPLIVAASLAAAITVGDAPLPAVLTAGAMVPAAVVDIREYRLPDRWVGFAGAVFAATTWIAWMLGQPVDIGAAAGALVMTAPILALHLVSPGSMGFGDVKASMVLGAAVGSVDWRLALMALTLASGLGAAVGIAGRRRAIAFGPCLVLAASIALAGAASISVGGTP
jgi:leader peptidase (prepilin peptidase)/N-methyltransferase